MKREPVPVIVISALYILTGAGNLVLHAGELISLSTENILVALLSLVALGSGIGMLRGRSRARLVALLWMAAHVLLSLQHSVAQSAFHVVLLAVFSWLLYRPSANRWFA